MALKLNRPQGAFLSSKKKFNGFVGGFRSGKTFVGCVRMWLLAMEFPGIKMGYFAPTYLLIGDIFLPTIELVGAALQETYGGTFRVGSHSQKKEVYLIIDGIRYATIKCRSMDKPGRIIGFDINHALIDEIDTLKMAQAEVVWQKIMARLSTKSEERPVNTADLTTTPEGYNFVYDLFIRRCKESPEIAGDYNLITASTRENEKNLPADYIPSLYRTYPANLVNAYVDGRFVNLKNKPVYAQFDRELNSCSTVWNGSEPVYIGMDFNVGKMCGVVHVKRNGLPHAVDELTGVYDTPEMINAIAERFVEIDGGIAAKMVYIYPDASGNSRKTNNASVSDISLLHQAGFTVVVDKKNPTVRDRIVSVNAMFCNGKGERRYMVNVNRCPVYTSALEQQIYTQSGEPEKKDDADHPVDAGGYFIQKVYPCRRHSTSMAFRG